MSATTKSNPVVIVGAAIGVGVLVILLGRMVSRMPPDPFEDNEPREIVVEVEWDGPKRTQHIIWEVGDESGTHIAHSTREQGDSWTLITTGFQGQTARVSSVQTAPGPVHCAIYVNEIQVDSVAAEDKTGCFAEATIP